MSALVEKHLAMVGASRAAAAYLDILPEFPELEAVWLVEPDPMRADRPEFQPLRRYAGVTDMLSARAIPDVALVHVLIVAVFRQGKRLGVLGNVLCSTVLRVPPLNAFGVTLCG